MRIFVLCIQIRCVSTEKTTRIASRASCCASCAIYLWNTLHGITIVAGCNAIFLLLLIIN